MSPDYLYLIVGLIFVTVIGFDIYNWSRGHSFVAPEVRIKRLWSKLNYSVLILGVTALVTAILLNVNVLSYRRPMAYALVNTITLKDFRGFKMPNETLDGGNEFAFITTSIEWDREGDQVVVNALFHPSRSYVYNNRTGDRFLLQHELYHFHVTEYFARLCRQELSGRSTPPASAEIAAIIKKNRLQERRVQYRYDDEAYHGVILQKQKQWQQKVDSLLSSVKAFENPKIGYN